MKKYENFRQLALKILKQASLIFLNVFLMIATLSTIIFLYIYLNTPSIASLVAKRTIPQTTILYDRTGKQVLYELHREENRKILPHEEIPDTIRLATIATEDDNFYQHFGIDLFSIGRALFKDVQDHDFHQGASTITQQLARNAFLSNDKTLKRKIMEVILAIKIERKFNKEQILDMYLNQVPYGSNAYGIEAAAETFFKKKAKDLTLDEAAMLSAMTKATFYYSPYGDNAQLLVVRQKEILERISNLKLASEQEIYLAKKENTLKKITPLQEPIKAPHFVFYVIGELEKKYGSLISEEGGLRVYTSLDYEMQQLAEKTISEASGYNLRRYGASNAALVAINPKNGQILSMVGSQDYFNKNIDGEVNVAIRPRQPGSSFKPFVYAKAFELGYEPENLLLDETTNFGPDGSGRPYIPHNYDGKTHGVVSMRQALAMSLNIPAIKTLYLVGIDNALEMAHRLGITTLNDRKRYGLSLVIGGGEVTLLDETAGFSVFANDGKRNPVDPFLKITDNQGKIIYQNEAKNNPILDSQVARKINSVLSDDEARIPIFGPNNKLHIEGHTVAVKTGTTQEWKDAWTVGYTPNLAVGVWAGNNDGHLMEKGADGSYVAAPIWNNFMSLLLANQVDQKFLPYEQNESTKSASNKFVDPFIKRLTAIDTQTVQHHGN